MEFKNGEFVGIYVLDEENCYEDETTPILLQKNYFEDRLININKKRYHENLPAIGRNRIKEWNINKFLFRYKGYIVAMASINNKIDFYGKDETRDDKFKHYLQLQEVKTFPIFYYDYVKDVIFNCNSNYKGYSSGRRGGGNGSVLKVKNAELLNEYINKKYANSLMEIKELKKFFDNNQTTCMLKEIDFFNIEPAHSNFLANYLKIDNSYGLNEFPAILFLRMIGENSKNISNIIVDSQKSFSVIADEKVGNVKRATPDITIMYTANRKKKMVLVEAKMNAEENIYNKINQSILYRDYIKDENYELFKVVVLKVNKKENINNKKKIVYIDYQDLIDNVYYPLLEKAKYNKDVLVDYLKSFWYTVDFSMFKRFDISLIPDNRLLSNEKALLDAIEKHLLKWDVENKTPKTNDMNTSQSVVFKYMLSLIYNDKKSSKKIKKIIEGLFGNL